MSSITASVPISGAATVLKCDRLFKTHSNIPQFQDISLSVGKGQRIGLIRTNGTGNSSLLKCLARVESVDGGTVEVATNAKVVYVDQEPVWGDKIVCDVLFGGDSEEAAAVENTWQYHPLTSPETTNASIWLLTP